MNQNQSQNELIELLDAMLSGGITSSEHGRLEELLAADSQARRIYFDYLDMHLQLRLWRKAETAARVDNFADLDVSGPPLAAPSLSTTHYPLPTNFVGGPVFSYLVASVVLCLMLLGAWAYKINHDTNGIAANSRRSTISSSLDQRPLVFVGRVTGMKDCRWAEADTQTIVGAAVSLDRRYALASGLMEITYKTGARVILEGPCTYKVESSAGGFLGRGKLTANISGQRSEVGKQKSPNSQSLIPNPFVVRTPMACVTDLGTEFGVEVGEKGQTKTQVFVGSVHMAEIAPNGEAGVGRVLHAGQAGILQSGKAEIVVTDTDESKTFVRAMPLPQIVYDSQAYAELVLALNPAVYYRMERPKPGEKPSRVFDSAFGGYHGEMRLGNEYGQPYLPGRFGKSLWFRGPEVCDHVIVSDYPKATNDQLTVSAWVLATSRPGWAMIASNWGRPQGEQVIIGQFHIGLYRRIGDLCVRIMPRDGQWLEIREGADQPLPLGVWQHVAMVADGEVLRLYRNGEEVASTPCIGIRPQSPLASLGIGCMTNAAGTDAISDVPNHNFWQGRIDELIIFNQALPAETVRRLYLGEKKDAQAGDASVGKGDGPMDYPQRF